ncbi:MAG: superoxide dismutase family protein [Oscillospiraceae bacterium]|nr:superoxide dismutase family protein [Oscillospiraceae bacterium]
MTPNMCSGAVARIRGEATSPEIRGEARFLQRPDGVLVTVEVSGLPRDTPFFALHIHEGRNCQGRGFPNTGSHLNGRKQPHPRHQGDLPPLLNAGGRAFLSVVTDRFTLPEIIGRTLVIHGGTDDFRTQPAGNAGAKLACGMIRCG